MVEISTNYNAGATTNTSGVKNQTYTQNSTNSASIFDSNSRSTKTNVNFLKDALEEVEDKQGFIGKAWNGIKNALGIGCSSNKASEMIEKYEKGEVSYEQALDSIEQFEIKQDKMVDTISNVGTGLIAAGATVATGGLAGVALGAAVGAGSKASIKALDRATNNVEGDALDSKQLGKDAIEGAIYGTFARGSMKAAKTAFSATTGFGGLKAGVVAGAKAGAKFGATTSAIDYTIDAGMNKDKNYKASDLLTSALHGAAAGAVAGGVFGGTLGTIAGIKAVPPTTP